LLKQLFVPPTEQKNCVFVQPTEQFKDVFVNIFLEMKLISIINDLEKINLIKQLKPCSFCYALVRSEYKLFLSLPFRYFFNSLLNKVPNVGSLRENFFCIFLIS
jgi:hypothetical protein